MINAAAICCSRIAEEGAVDNAIVVACIVETAAVNGRVPIKADVANIKTVLCIKTASITRRIVAIKEEVIDIFCTTAGIFRYLG